MNTKTNPKHAFTRTDVRNGRLSDQWREPATARPHFVADSPLVAELRPIGGHTDGTLQTDADP